MDEDRSRSRRFFVELLPHAAGETIPLPLTEAHHALHVLRLGVGAEVELFDGRGGRARGTISVVARGQVTVSAGELPPPHPRPQPLIRLGFAQPKGKRLDWLLEKATELGAAALVPVRFARSVAGREDMSENRRQRWLAHCVAAAKQCGLDFLPELNEPLDLLDFLAAHRDDLRLLGDGDAAENSLRKVLDSRAPGTGVCLLIGPEGGLTGEERSEAIAAGFVPVRLGRTTLRTETAAIALLAAVTAICEGSR